MNNLEQFVESLKRETEENFQTINKTISVEITGAVKRVVKQQLNAKPSAAKVRVDDPASDSNPNQRSATGLADASSNFNMIANVAPEVAFLLN
jgi:hypothetical protein